MKEIRYIDKKRKRKEGKAGRTIVPFLTRNSSIAMKINDRNPLGFV